MAHPPHQHHHTERISPAHALSLLSSYLERTTTDASYHPNALLTANGPTTPAAGAQNLGLVLHNLKRVEAGLKGERLGADPPIGKHGAQGLPGLMPLSNGRADSFPEGSGDALGNSAGAEEVWQDKAEFDRQQEIVQGEIGQRDNAPGEGGNVHGVPKVEATKTTADKAIRRLKKAERRRQERREHQLEHERMKDSGD